MESIIKIPRLLAENLALQLQESTKALILYGPRQAGKTTLVKDVLSGLSYRVLEINADEERYFDVLSSRDSQRLGELVASIDGISPDQECDGYTEFQKSGDRRRQLRQSFESCFTDSAKRVASKNAG